MTEIKLVRREKFYRRSGAAEDSIIVLRSTADVF